MFPPHLFYMKSGEDGGEERKRQVWLGPISNPENSGGEMAIFAALILAIHLVPWYNDRVL